MNAHIRVTAAALAPLLALAPSCAGPSREVSKAGETVVHVPEDRGRPIEVPEAELWRSFHVAARELRAPADPLAFAEQTFGLAEPSGTYGPEERLTRGYLEWCGGTRLGGGDCLRLLNHGDGLTLRGRYVVTLVMAMTASFGRCWTA